MLLHDLVETSVTVGATPARLAKVDALAAALAVVIRKDVEDHDRELPEALADLEAAIGLEERT
jgi:hypothetical protein